MAAIDDMRPNVRNGRATRATGRPPQPSKDSRSQTIIKNYCFGLPKKAC
jgi:hypothetical protein